MLLALEKNEIMKITIQRSVTSTKKSEDVHLQMVDVKLQTIYESA